MSAKRWSNDEEFKLIKFYSDGLDYEYISGQLDRTPSALKLRMEKIVYDNIAKGRSVSSLSKALNKDQGKITQMFYTHRDFKEKQGEKVIDLNKIHMNSESNINMNGSNINMNGSNINMNGGSHNSDNSGVVNTYSMRDSNPPNKSNQTDVFFGRTDSKNKKPNKKAKRPNNEQHGGDINNIELNEQEKKLKYIENENKILKAIVDNYQMKRQLKKLYKEHKLDKTSRKIFRSTFMKK